VLAKEIFESRVLRKRAFYADDLCLIFCGEVPEVLKRLRDAKIIVDRSTSSLFSNASVYISLNQRLDTHPAR
jgi:Zn-dependent protease with chaperone function